MVMGTAALAAGVVMADPPATPFISATPPSPTADRPQTGWIEMGQPVPAEPSPTCAPNCCPDAKAAPFTPFMLGDFVGPVANLFTNFKIAEDESPRPTDRVFFKYNYYNNINPTRWRDPTEPIHNVDLNLYTFGMEKTFFDGAVSIGARFPFYTMDAEGKTAHLAPDPVTGRLVPVPGGPGFSETEFGNSMAIVKATLWENRASGDLLSGGAIISIPTASNQKLDPGLSTLAYVQPFTGFILTSGDLYLQGFLSTIMPVARPESIVVFSDVGVGYYLYRDASCSHLISGIAPTFEVHYAAPLRQVDPTANFFGNFVDTQPVHNTVDLTTGATLEFGRRATLGVGVSVPVTGQRPFDVEGLVQLNMLF
jgi:hypothetical protein